MFVIIMRVRSGEEKRVNGSASRQPQTIHGENTRERVENTKQTSFLFIRIPLQSRRLSLMDSYVRLVRFLHSVLASRSSQLFFLHYENLLFAHSRPVLRDATSSVRFLCQSRKLKNA